LELKNYDVDIVLNYQSYEYALQHVIYNTKGHLSPDTEELFYDSLEAFNNAKEDIEIITDEDYNKTY